MNGREPDSAAGPPQEALDAVRAAARIALIGHVTPDADCLGAMGALYVALSSAGRRAFAALPPHSVSRRLGFLVREAGMSDASHADLRTCDLAVVLDTARPQRVNVAGGLEALRGLAVLNVDHHATNPRFGRWNWVEPARSSTSEMVYDLLEALGLDGSPAVATLLYAGIHSDTRGFSLSNTTPRSLAVAHRLAAAGARISDLCERLHRSNSRGEFALLRLVYANTRVSDDGLLAWSTVAFDEIVASGCGPADVDEQVDVPRSLEGIRAAILFTEGERRRIRMNFRGESGTDVLELARQFGGGGHRSSAGAVLDGALDEIVERVVSAAQAYLSDRAARVGGGAV